MAAILRNQCAADDTPREIPIANTITGKPVPIPKKRGRIIPNLLLSAKGIRLPKNNPAEIGQKDSAKIAPNKNAPFAPELAKDSCFFLESENPEMLRRIISKRNIPTTSNMGPTTLFIYFCKKFATDGMLTRDAIIAMPKKAYAIIRPSVYALPDHNTAFG